LHDVTRTFGVGGVLLLLIATQAGAHHSFFGEFDRNQPLTVRGTVTRIEWTNPHIRFFVAVTGRRGVVTWTFSGAAASTLERQGITLTTIKVGDVIRVDGFRSLDGSLSAAAGAVTLPNRKRLFIGPLQEPTPL
jgi:hypothetical protein